MRDETIVNNYRKEFRYASYKFCVILVTWAFSPVYVRGQLPCRSGLILYHKPSCLIRIFAVGVIACSASRLMIWIFTEIYGNALGASRHAVVLFRNFAFNVWVSMNKVSSWISKTRRLAGAHTSDIGLTLRPLLREREPKQTVIINCKFVERHKVNDIISSIALIS